MPQVPAYDGSVGDAPAAEPASTAAASNGRNNFTTTTLHTNSRAIRLQPGSNQAAVVEPLRLAVEGRVDLGDLLRLERVARLGAVAVAVVGQLRLAAEVEPEAGEAFAAVGRLDLLERGEQLLLGLRPLVRRHRHLVRRADVDVPVPLQAGRRRDQLPDDDVLLQPEQPVDLALDRGVGEHLRRLLEGGGGEERLGRERRLRDPEDQRLRRRLVLALLPLDARVLAVEHELVDELARQQIRAARVVHADLLQHLPHDELDVLVVDLDALRLVDLLHLVDEVQLDRRVPLQTEQVGRADRALGERVTRLDPVAVRDEQPRAARNRVRLVVVLVAAVGDDRDLDLALRLLDRDETVDLRALRGALRVAGLEELDDTRQAVRDVRAGDTAGMERPHRQLRARLADRLGGDDADRVADLRHLARREERAVARLAHADVGRALEHRADRHDEVLGNVLERLDDLPQARHRQLLAPLGDQRLAGLARGERLEHVVAEDASGDALVQPLRQEERQLDEVLRLAVELTDDHVLRDVDETPRQVARVGGAERGVCETLARTVGRDEVLEHRQAFHEVGLDRALDDLALRIRHQTAHAGELAKLCERAAGTRVGHHVDRVQLVQV